jgi:hypothetical protein
MKYPHDYMDFQTDGETENEKPRKVSDKRIANKARKVRMDILKLISDVTTNANASRLTDYSTLKGAADHLKDLNSLLTWTENIDRQNDDIIY